MSSSSSSTRSKLGTEYRLADIEPQQKAYLNELRSLAKRCGGCADCGATANSWSSVNNGVFLCVDCAQIHRGVGTHVTKVKSCQGTYRWHPDEMAVMRAKAVNHRQLYPAGTMPKPTNDFVLHKYGSAANVCVSAVCSVRLPSAAAASSAAAAMTATGATATGAGARHPECQLPQHGYCFHDSNAPSGFGCDSRTTVAHRSGSTNGGSGMFGSLFSKVVGIFS